MTFDWIIPIGPNEDIGVVTIAIRSVLNNIDLGDKCVVVCTSETWTALNIADDRFTRVAPPAKRSAAAWRNAAIPYLEHEYAIFQDADDESLPNRRDSVVLAAASSHCDILAFGYELMDQGGAPLGTRLPLGTDASFWFRSNIYLPACAIRSSLLRTLRFQEDIQIGEDSLLFGECLARGGVVSRITIPSIRYRLVESKVAAKRGLRGVSHELRYRWRLLKVAPPRYKLQVAAGALVAVIVKLMPQGVFWKIYWRSHRG